MYPQGILSHIEELLAGIFVLQVKERFMKPVTFIVLITLLVLPGCAPSPDSPGANEPATEPAQGDYIPNPSDASLLRGEVFLDSVSLLTLEIYPPQFMLNLKGSLPTPCHHLRIAVSPPDASNKVAVDVYSVTNPDEICAQVLEPFEVNYSLGSYPQGTYSLWVNGEMVAEFQS